MENTTYRIVFGNKVEIKNSICTYVLNRKNLEQSIENVKAEHRYFARESAFLHQLQIRQGALKFLIANTKLS